MSLKFSIITCTRNSKPYVSASISSVLAQDHANIEYIFVDGGSTDGTLEEVQSINRPITLVQGVTGGIASAMNAGIAVATGDVIAHMHSDDYYIRNDAISIAARAFRNESKKWAFGRSVSDVDGRMVPEAYIAPIYSYSMLLKRNFVPHAATFVRRSVFQELGNFDSAYRLAMDYEMWLRIGKSYQPTIIQEPLAAFRRHQGSATQMNQLASLNEDFRVRFKYAPPYRYPDFVVRYIKRRYELTLKARSNGNDLGLINK